MEYCQLKVDPDGVRHAHASVVVHADLSRNVYFRRVKVPVACKALTDFPPIIEAPSGVSKLVEFVDRAVVCPGTGMCCCL